MKILAIDSSNQPLTVGILENNIILNEQIINIKRNHSIQLMPAIDQALKQTNLKIEEMDALAVANGPGSYTGLRIAVTVAKSLAWAQNTKLIGVSSLKVIAANSQSKNPTYIVPVFDARRENIYTGLYQRNEAGHLMQIETDTHIAAEPYASYLANKKGNFELIGTDAKKFYDTFKKTLGDRVTLAHPSLNLPRAGHLAFLAQNEKETPVHELVPSYLKLAEAEENWLKENPDDEGDNWVEKV